MAAMACPSTHREILQLRRSSRELFSTTAARIPLRHPTDGHCMSLLWVIFSSLAHAWDQFAGFVTNISLATHQKFLPSWSALITPTSSYIKMVTKVQSPSQYLASGLNPHRLLGTKVKTLRNISPSLSLSCGKPTMVTKTILDP